MDTLERVDQAVEAARTFKPMSKQEVAKLVSKTKDAAMKGEFELFKTSSRGTSFWSSTFDAVRDGKEFLAISLGAEEDVPGTLVLNWTAKVRK